ncbi:MAG TPA: AAA family ATPase, partial [Longimicrobium sp.]|nr:AAA family ATPase [Longimicrobium sp.]
MIPGVVCTFYSYKGGVGRTMALANVAAELARLGNRVLVLDWDLEAPGIEKYFEDANLGQTRFPDGPGILELIYACVEDVALDWKECVIHATPFPAAQVDIIRSGERGNGYVGRLQAVNWSTLFEEHEFGLYLERLRCEWVAEYDYVLVDSRTGITDIGGICTIHLP